MKGIRKAIKAAMTPAMVKRAVKDAAESHVRGAAYRELSKMQQEEEAKEGERDDVHNASPSAVPAPTGMPSAPTTPHGMIERARRK